MKTIWLFYARDAYTMARHYDYALRKLGHKVLSFGQNNEYPTGNQVVVPEMLKKFSPPDLILNFDGFSPMVLLGLSQVPCPKAAYVIDTHISEERGVTLFEYDRLFVCHFATVKKWSSMKPDWVQWLPSAADEEIHREIPHVPVVYDSAFVGGIDLFEVHHTRRACLKALLASDLRVFAGRTTGLFMSFIYSKSKTVFNYSIKSEINMRMMEALAVKRVLVTNIIDPDQGFEALGFKPNENCLIYSTPEECAAVTKKIVGEYSRLKKIGQAGYELFMEKHTYRHRAETVLNELASIDKKPDTVKA